MQFHSINPSFMCGHKQVCRVVRDITDYQEYINFTFLQQCPSAQDCRFTVQHNNEVTDHVA